MSVSDHYFSAQPASEDERRTITVTLGGSQVQVTTAPGVFSPDHVDLGTQVLMRHLPPPPQGVLVDLGCGWGPLSLHAAMLEPRARILAVDVNERSLDLVRTNVELLGRQFPMATVEALTPEQVDPGMVIDALWSNPPIRIGKAALHELLTRWLPRLRAGAHAHLVVSKNLGADSLASWIGGQGQPRWGSVHKVASAKGFRVLEFTKAP